MDIPIIYEDERLVVIDKPPGIVVNRAENVKIETLQDWAENKLKVKSEKLKVEEKNFYDRSGIVHRLDKDTSGLLIIAKDEPTFSTLQSQFANREVVKKYTSLVHGKVSPSLGVIKAPVGRLTWNRKRFGVLVSGRPAVTYYQVVSFYNLESRKYTLLEVKPQTGRTHQIRVHLKYINHPIVSDYLYAGRATTKLDIKFCPRLFLHASYLKFKHPEREEWLELKSNLPNDLERVLSKLKVLN